MLCIVVGCSKRSGRDKDVSFYRIPKVVTNRGHGVKKLSQKRRQGFLSAIKRDNLTQKILSNDRICSKHFVSGKLASLLDETNPDWLPSLNLGHSREVCEDKAKAAEERWIRAKSRESLKDNRPILLSEATESGSCNSNEGQVTQATCQTDLTSTIMNKKDEELLKCKRQISILQAEILVLKEMMQTFTEKDFINDEECVKFYTGLPNFKVLKTLFEFICSPCSGNTKLNPFQEYVMTLMKLRLDSPYKDLAYRFGVSVTTVSRVFSKWLTLMDTVLRSLIIWPDRDSLWKTMPKCFRSSFGKDVAVIVRE